MTPDAAEELIPVAAELVGTVRDFGPDDVAAVLARVPGGRHDALAVVLAAMVDPDARLSELLAWTHSGPVVSPSRKRDWDRLRRCPECGQERRSSNLARHRRTHLKNRARAS